MKRLVMLVLVLLVLMTMVVTAVADYYPTPHTGIVLATSISCRKAPDERADKFGSLPNGTEITLIGESGDFYIVDLCSTPFVDEVLTEAYVMKTFVGADTYEITIPYETNLLIAPYDGAKANAQKSAGTVMRVIGEMNDWLIVQCRKDSAGSSFIRKSVAYGWATMTEQQSWQGQKPSNSETSYSVATGTMAVVTASQSLRVRRDPSEDGETLGFLHTNDRVEKVGGEINGFQGIKYDYCGATVCAYVHSKYLMDILE